MTPRIAIAVLACALPMAASAQARDVGTPSVRDYLSKMDADGDARVSLPEYQDWLSYAFDAMDRDRDGVLSAAEQPGGRAAPLTRVTHRERLAELFRRQDANHDRFLSAKELASPPQ